MEHGVVWLLVFVIIYVSVEISDVFWQFVSVHQSKPVSRLQLPYRRKQSRDRAGLHRSLVCVGVGVGAFWLKQTSDVILAAWKICLCVS